MLSYSWSVKSLTMSNGLREAAEMLDRNVVQRVRQRRQSGVLQRDGSLIFVVFTEPVSMRAIVRTRDELFTRTVAQRAHSFDIVVNGNYFGVTRGGMLDAFVGHDSVAASETIVQGQVVQAGQPTIGDSRPQRFFLAEIVEQGTGSRPGRLRYVTGFGNPPSGARTVTALGNLGPLLSGGLPYGQGNRYRPGTRGPATGDPGPRARGNLVQRNDATFASVEKLGATTGKTVVAYHHREEALLVGVQPHGRSPGQSYSRLRDALGIAGFSDAVFLDGSDSAMLWHRGRCIVEPGEDKNELMTVGLGFVRRASARR
ncbi:hypothetical protein [Sphingomonas sp. PB4P5]|uniref:hypothetical protein n=1 Tax=Parasphingomonas puruogangriensis TaxID=3096155 RepID=UPI002FC7B107